MTRSRKLKQAIRARAARTGERYTAARRHVLAARERRRGAPPAPAPASPAPATSPRGGMSETAVVAKTGHGLDHWFAVLDAFGAATKGHTASARHLAREHGVPGWHAQGVTVAYERARGLRAMNQARGGFQVTVTRVVPAAVPDVVDALRGRPAWLERADPGLRAALARAVRPPAKGVVTRADGVARLRYKWEATTVEMRIEPRPRGASVAIGNMGLADAAAVERRRAQWRAALESLKAAFA
jgi:hypothetical protein